MEESTRVLALSAIHLVGKTIRLKGWVERVRTHGKLVFLDLRDRSASIQVVVNEAVSKEAFVVAQNLKPEYAITIDGKVNPRSERTINKSLATGTVEVEAAKISILSEADTLPFDTTKKELHLELPTLLDFRSLTLRHPKQREIFTIQAAIAESFREVAKKLSCTEIFVPTIVAGATEGGAEVFRVDYYEYKAFMSQSPQLYKQIMVGVLERVFTIAKAYRAEPSVTTRHLSESTQMDIEIGFIENFEELLDMLEYVGTYMIGEVSKKYQSILENFGVPMPLIPKHIPRLTLREAQEIIFKQTGRDVRRDPDLNPEDEKEICKWASEEKKSDFVTITHFPTKKKPFYTHPDPENPEYSLSYDLLFRGIEVLSGSQRINDYRELINSMKTRGLEPERFGIYLMAFKYGMPPEGGFSFGLERLTMKLLELSNIREASLFPRDMERVDERFAVLSQKREKAL